MLPADDLEARAERLADRLRAAGFSVTLGLCCDVAGAAAVLGVSQRTLRRWRDEQRGPRTVTAGRLWYPLTELLRFLDD